MKKIGYFKYSILKGMPGLSEEEKSQIKEYEEERNIGIKTDYEIEYATKLFEMVDEPKPIILTSEQIYTELLRQWDIIHRKPLILTDEMKQNLKTVNRYFAGDERFAEGCIKSTDSTDSGDINDPSLDKGLLLMGGFGNAKTSIMKCYQAMFANDPHRRFKSLTGHEVRRMYEDCSEQSDKTHFWKTVLNGNTHFDDVKAEREANNFGKVNLFREILEQRSEISAKTHITCNTRGNDVQSGLDEFEDMYGSRVYDRLFSMFNIIHWQGKSMRR